MAKHLPLPPALTAGLLLLLPFVLESMSAAVTERSTTASLRQAQRVGRPQKQNVGNLDAVFDRRTRPHLASPATKGLNDGLLRVSTVPAQKPTVASTFSSLEDAVPTESSTSAFTSQRSSDDHLASPTEQQLFMASENVSTMVPRTLPFTIPMDGPTSSLPTHHRLRQYCNLVPHEVDITKEGCTGRLDVKQCAGACYSESLPQGRETKDVGQGIEWFALNPARSRNCAAKKLSTKTIELQCTDGRTVMATVTIVEKCRCQLGKCNVEPTSR